SRGHARVAVYFAVVANTFLLPFPGADDAFANGIGAFLRALAGDIAIFDRRHFNMQIDAIEQRPGNALTISLHLHRSAAAFALEIAEVAARARVHCGDEHELRRKRDAACGAGDGDFAVFERFAHHLQCRSIEIRQLIQKEDTVVGEAYFARIWKSPTTAQTNVTNGMMRS